MLESNAGHGPRRRTTGIGMGQIQAHGDQPHPKPQQGNKEYPTNTGGLVNKVPSSMKKMAGQSPSVRKKVSVPAR